MVSAIVQSARTIMTTKTKSADATDHSVGGKIRAQRIIRGLSQTELGNKIGVTFQQVQKYEKGSNRVSAGRLKQIADILEVPVSFFFEGASGKDMAVENINEAFSFLETAASVRLVRAFAEIENKNIRSSIVTLVEGIAGSERGRRK
jgi:transcriptional regulator with XRE-family HTH domain